MKKLISFLAMIAFALLLMPVMAQVDTTAVKHTLDPSTTPLPGAAWTEWVGWIIGILLFLWETILRIVPTAKDWTLVSKIISILNWIAGLFNGGLGNAAKMPNGVKGSFKNTKVTL